MRKPNLNDFIFTGYLIDPSRMPETFSAGGYENIDVELILSILKGNKVPLVYLNKELFETYPQFFNSSEFNAEYEKENATCQLQRSEWAKVREAFLKNSIESMLIKSVGSFPYKSSNVDVLIRECDRKPAEIILKDMGYIQLHNVEEPYKTLFRMFAGGEPTSVIHLHNKVAWMNPFHEEELLWARYRHWSEDYLINTPSREDSILILTAHWFYEDKEIKLSDIQNICACLMKGELDWEYMIAVAGKRGWLDGFYFGLLVQSFVEKKLYGKSLIESDQLEEMKLALPMWMRTYFKNKVYSQKIELPFKLQKIFGKSLHFVKTLKDNTTTPAKKIYEMIVVAHGSLFVVLFEKLKVNIRYQPAMLIAVSGVDGSGKSTYAAILADILDLCELRKRIVWSRVGSSNFLKPFSKMASIFYYLKTGKGFKKKFDNFEESETRRKVLFGKSSVPKLVGVHLLLLEMLWQYFFKVTLPLLRKKVVICDRYIYDTLVDVTTRYGIDPNDNEGKLFRKILTTITPKPDLSYVLFIPHEEAINRENVDLAERQLVKLQVKTYRDIARDFNLLKIYTHDKTRITDISDEMIYEILTKYYEKWPNK